MIAIPSLVTTPVQQTRCKKNLSKTMAWLHMISWTSQQSRFCLRLIMHAYCTMQKTEPDLVYISWLCNDVMYAIAIPEGVLLGPAQTWGSSQSSAPISLSLRPGGSQRLCPARGTSPPWTLTPTICWTPHGSPPAVVRVCRKEWGGEGCS